MIVHTNIEKHAISYTIMHELQICTINKRLVRAKGYKKLPECRPFHKRIVFVPSKILTTGRKTKLLHRKLGQTYLRSRKLADCKGFQVGVHTTASADNTPRGTRVLSFREKLIEKDIKDLESNGDCKPSSSYSRPVHKQLISCQEKRRQKSASNKSEAVGWLC